MRRYVTLACIAALSGCASTNALRTKLSSDAAETKDEKRVLIVEMRKAYQNCRPYGAKTATPNSQPTPNPDMVSSAECAGIDPSLAAFRRAGDAKALTGANKTLQDRVVRFMDAGTTLSDIYCDEFFRAVNTSARKRQFAKGAFVDASSLIAGVLNLVKAGSNALTASTVGFNAVNASFRNYDESFMVDADLAKLRRLVLAAQDSMKLKLESEPPRTIFAAESKIIRYAGLCSFLGMKDLLNDSIATKTKDIETENAQDTIGSNSGALGAAPGAPGAGSPTPTSQRPAAAPASTVAPTPNSPYMLKAPLSQQPPPG